MNRISLIAVLLCSVVGMEAMAQSKVVSKNKSLAFLNPAYQDKGYEKGQVSFSYLTGSLSEEESYLNYLGMGEVKFGNFRVGAHASSVNNKYNRLDMYKVYGSFGYEFEPGNSIYLGVEGGYYTDQAKLGFFNQVFAPTQYVYADSSVGQLDLGLGLMIESQGLIVGVALNKLNKPSYVSYPVQLWEEDPNDSLVLIKKDTSVVLGSEQNLQYTLQSVITLGYEWHLGNTTIEHLFNVYNLDLAGYDFVDFQNIISFQDRWAVSLGMFSNGALSFMGSVAYAFSPMMQLEVAAFLQEEYEYDPDAEYPIFFVDGYTINAKGASKSIGYRPSLEANLQFRF